MKTGKRHRLILSMLLSCAFLFQSCVVYQKNPVSLVEAAEQRNRTRITTSNQGTLKYAFIVRENGVFYGVKMQGGKAIQTPLSEEEILEIRLQDNTSSKWATISVAILATLVVAGALFGADITIFGHEVE